jgi:hypothetical protein
MWHFKLKMNVLSGAVFIFMNKKHTQVKTALEGK